MNEIFYETELQGYTIRLEAIVETLKDSESAKQFSRSLLNRDYQFLVDKRHFGVYSNAEEGETYIQEENDEEGSSEEYSHTPSDEFSEDEEEELKSEEHNSEEDSEEYKSEEEENGN